ncbi:hypothetical protein AVME950_00340 [Acidovorax sp. SUPP950]|uniref:hypothetical protein n=1 Tax=Acidovorax sp. SUPP950 TaxID=511901 RepID=UPI0023C5DFFF|nr:hypothetical protein [Acidovorax sp. SUPP950]GKS73286.1 hypothetical protein AVME950_00340 [Acidovorax sp. SUPP950]
MSPSEAVEKAEQDALTIEALELLRRAASYFDRLPAVPTTRQLAKELAEFVESPKARATQRAVMARQEATTAKYAHVSAVTGLTLFQAVVAGDSLYLKAPPYGGYIDDLGRMRQLHRGVRFELKAPPSDFAPWHLDLV